MGPFFGLEFETMSTVPRGLAAGRNGQPQRFGTIIQVIKFNFVIVAIGSWAKIYFSHPSPSLGRGGGVGWGVESTDPLSKWGLGQDMWKSPWLWQQAGRSSTVLWRSPDDSGRLGGGGWWWNWSVTLYSNPRGEKGARAHPLWKENELPGPTVALSVHPEPRFCLIGLSLQFEALLLGGLRKETGGPTLVACPMWMASAHCIPVTVIWMGNKARILIVYMDNREAHLLTLDSWALRGSPSSLRAQPLGSRLAQPPGRTGLDEAQAPPSRQPPKA